MALLSNDPTKNVGALRQLNAQLEAVEDEHMAKAANDLAVFLEKAKALTANAPTVDPANFLDQDLKAYDALMKAYDQIGVKSSDFYAAQVQTAQAAYAVIDASGTASYGDILLAQMKVAQAEEDYAKSVGDDWSGEAAQLKTLQKAYDEFTGKVTDGGTQMDSIGKTLSRDFGSFFSNIASGTKGAASAFQSLVKSLLQSLDQMIAKMIMTWMWGKIIGLFGSAASGGVDISGNTDIAPTGLDGILGTVPGHAAGGYMGGGTPGIIGERGPELWIPSAAGTVIPNSALGGGAGGVTMNVDLRGSGTQLTRQEFAMGLKQAMAQTKLETMFAVRDMQLRRA
jgi:lambda family phage tail tape measure protein